MRASLKLLAVIAVLAGVARLLAGEAAQGAELPGCFPATVVRVYDGDTFTAQVRPWRPGWIAEESFRLTGYNTAELKKGPCRAAGRAARDYLAKLVSGRSVILCQVSFDDPYGRVLAWVSVDGVDVAQAMIAAGLAVAYHGEGKAGTWCPAGQ